jgi:hypothetical protein
MTYQPVFRAQADGSECQWHNCSPTSHSMAVDRDWLGAQPATPKAIRNRINLFCPGTTLTQNKAAVGTLYETSTQPMFGTPWQTFVDGIVAGRGAVVSILYSAVHGTPFDGCRSFDGRHAIYVNSRRWNATLSRYEFHVFDPLADHRFSWIPQGPQWWPASLLKKAMLAALGNIGSVDCSFTRNTQSKVKKALFAGGKLRSGAAITFASKGDLRRGALCTVEATEIGGPWTVNGSGGKNWYAISAIDGKTVDSLFGIARVHAAQGWFTGRGGAV